MGTGAGATGSALSAAFRCSCNRASYPGDGVTVGGAARTCESDPPTVASARTATAAPNRFIRPSASVAATPERIGPNRSHFKAASPRQRLDNRVYLMMRTVIRGWLYVLFV